MKHRTIDELEALESDIGSGSLLNRTLAINEAKSLARQLIEVMKERDALKAEREWVPIADIDLPVSRCAPFSMIVSHHNEEMCQSIKHVGDYIPDFITYIKPLDAPPPNQPEEAG